MLSEDLIMVDPVSKICYLKNPTMCVQPLAIIWKINSCSVDILTRPGMIEICQEQLKTSMSTRMHLASHILTEAMIPDASNVIQSVMSRHATMTGHPTDLRESFMKTIYERILGDSIDNPSMIALATSVTSTIWNHFLALLGVDQQIDRHHIPPFVTVTKPMFISRYQVTATQNTTTATWDKTCEPEPAATSLKEEAMRRLKKAWTIVEAPNKTSEKFPHSCPKCGAPAYVGFSSIDCSKNCK